MKIRVVCSKFPPEYAGAGVRVHNTYRRLAAAGHDVRWSVITNAVEFPGNACYRHDGIPVRRISTRLFAHWRAAPGLAGRLQHALRSWWEALQVWAALAGDRPDVIHVFGSSAATAAAIAWARVTGTPLVIELVTARASPAQHLPGLNWSRWLRLDRNTLIVAISAALAETCARLGLDRNVWTRPNPVDTKRFLPEPQRRHALRAALTPFAAHDIVLSMVAKFMPQKNQIFLLDVLARLPEQYKLVLAGPVVESGPLLERDRAYLAQLHDRIAALGLGARVHVVTGFVPAGDFMKLADAYVLPNKDEGLATPMLEALACGLPVVANDGEAAFCQWVTDGVSGFLRPLDADLWAQAVQNAVALPTAGVMDEAGRIADQASATTVDGRFLALVTALAALPPGGRIDVEAQP
ncbi:MAG: glycosyltransferase [Rhodospirillaceae bacterium]|nr:glycosyltransferase [Rhodospirillales bacterium]